MHSSIVKLPRRLRRIPTGVARGCSLLAAFIGVLATGTGTASADVMAQFQSLRQSGCGGSSRYEAPLERLGSLDVAARLLAGGARLGEAMSRSSYLATRVSSLHIRGASAMTASQSCRIIRDSALRHLGVYQHGADIWLVLAAPAYPGTAAEALWRAASAPPAPLLPSVAPVPADTGVTQTLPERVLELVNAARARGRRCGTQYFPAVAPVRLSATLDEVASQHAVDMAQHGYFDHIDLDGRTPADRVKAVGYHERLVGENIAYGPTSVGEVVAGWLASPGHCENIMDPRFAEMGLALAPGSARPHGEYWVQLLVKPAIPHR